MGHFLFVQNYFFKYIGIIHDIISLMHIPIMYVLLQNKANESYVAISTVLNKYLSSFVW